MRDRSFAVVFLFFLSFPLCPLLYVSLLYICTTTLLFSRESFSQLLVFFSFFFLSIFFFFPSAYSVGLRYYTSFEIKACKLSTRFSQIIVPFVSLAAVCESTETTTNETVWSSSEKDQYQVRRECNYLFFSSLSWSFTFFHTLCQILISRAPCTYNISMHCNKSVQLCIGVQDRCITYVRCGITSDRGKEQITLEPVCWYSTVDFFFFFLLFQAALA